MKNWTKLLALLLAAAMCLALLAGCAGTDKPAAETPAEDTPAADETENTPADEPAPDAEPEEDGEEPAEPEDIVEITADFLFLGADTEPTAEVGEKINEITEKNGVHVNINFFGFGEFMTQVGMQIAAGDDLDLVWLTGLPGANLATLQGNGQLLDIAPYLGEDYCAGIRETVGEYLEAFTYGDAVYGLPVNRLYASTNYLIMRTDLLEEMGMLETAQNMDNWGTAEEILYAFRDAYPDMGAITRGAAETVVNIGGSIAAGIADGAKFSESYAFDTLGDGTNLLMSDEEGHVMKVYENEDYVNNMKTVAKWYQDGVAYADSPNLDDMGQTYVKNGNVFSIVMTGELGIESQTGCGYDMTCVPLVTGSISTAALTTWGLALPVTCDEPEATLKFVDMLYTNADIATMLAWGVEGRDWVRNDDGTAGYPEGVDSSNVQYHGGDFIVGNQMLVMPWADQGADFRDCSVAYNESSAISKYLGFSLDTTELANLIGGISAANDEYYGPLNCGLYTDDGYADYCAKLEAAGMDSYVAAVQSQLDAWLAAK